MAGKSEKRASAAHSLGKTGRPAVDVHCPKLVSLVYFVTSLRENAESAEP